METKSLKKTIKNQKITIIILSILLTIFFIISVMLIRHYSIKEKNMEVVLNKYYTITGSFYTYYEVSIFCNINKTIEVKDFTFKHNNQYICVSKIEYNDVEYETNESFVIYPKQENILIIYISLVNDETTNIYYKNNLIKLHNSIYIT